MWRASTIKLKWSIVSSNCWALLFDDPSQLILLCCIKPRSWSRLNWKFVQFRLMSRLKSWLIGVKYWLPTFTHEILTQRRHIKTLEKNYKFQLQHWQSQLTTQPLVGISILLSFVSWITYYEFKKWESHDRVGRLQHHSGFAVHVAVVLHLKKLLSCRDCISHNIFLTVASSPTSSSLSYLLFTHRFSVRV